ncbi:alpha/beta fold hydrolase [Aridibaculum aurantiacum]|uniref:alpha/beta fold hydrolase n=1 Tax=Aridibaculum aurantiacum TaxID=2810307 RepID=UPI001A97440A|nr:alpha/beta hydrolase [Aridibaculum aurantiacum]
MKKALSLCLFLFFAFFGFAQPPAFIVEKRGTGKPIIFLPGFTTPGSVWYETVKNLEGNYESHLITYAGFGGVAPIDTPWYPSIQQQLIAYIHKEKLSQVTIIGHSMGGTLAMDIAAALPGKIDKLVLVDALPNMRALMMPGVSAEQVQYNSPYNKQMLEMKDDAFRQVATLMAGNMTNNKEKNDTILKWSLTADRKTYVYGFTDLLKVDLEEKLPLIKAKTLILGATFPTMEVAKATMEKQYATLNEKQIEFAIGSKHFIMFDQPGWFCAQVNAFLQK